MTQASQGDVVAFCKLVDRIQPLLQRLSHHDAEHFAWLEDELWAAIQRHPPLDAR